MPDGAEEAECVDGGNGDGEGGDTEADDEHVEQVPRILCRARKRVHRRRGAARRGISFRATCLEGYELSCPAPRCRSRFVSSVTGFNDTLTLMNGWNQ